MAGLLGAIALHTVVQAQTQAQAQPQTRTYTQGDWATLEQNILVEHNKVRQNPASYIPIMEAHLAAMDSRGSVPNACGPNCILQTVEGKAAVEEAIAFLRHQPALDPIELSSGVAQAAKAHAIDQAGGATGHIGSDGSDPGQRFRQQGVQARGWGENIAYGSPTAQEVVRDLIIDDGVASRGHRTNIFKADWTHAGTGCGIHAVFRNVCVIGYTIESQESQGSQAREATNGDRRESMPMPTENQFTVIHNGTVVLRSLQIGNTNILDNPLVPGQSRDIALSANQCRADLRLQLEGNYAPFDWLNLPLCGSTLTISAGNELSLQYQQR